MKAFPQIYASDVFELFICIGWYLLDVQQWAVPVPTRYSLILIRSALILF